jgi:hypothetical protein
MPRCLERKLTLWTLDILPPYLNLDRTPRLHAGCLAQGIYHHETLFYAGNDNVAVGRAEGNCLRQTDDSWIGRRKRQGDAIVVPSVSPSLTESPSATVTFQGCRKGLSEPDPVGSVVI